MPGSQDAQRRIAIIVTIVIGTLRQSAGMALWGSEDPSSKRVWLGRQQTARESGKV